MKNRQKTADRNYVIKLNASRSAEAHSIMHDIVRGNETVEENKDDETPGKLETDDNNLEEESIWKEHQKTAAQKASPSTETHSRMRDTD